ncbi:hypothetical protein [Streptomyces phaeochromogenes]
MAGEGAPRLPETEPHQCRRTAEDLLNLSDADVPRAIAWGILAVAGELAQIRRDVHRRSR